MNIYPKISFKIFLIPLLISTFSFTQTLDEKFLDSLPEDVKNDLLQEVNTKQESEDAQYRRASTFIDKTDLEDGRFGYQVFSRMQTTFMPLNEPNFDGSYILDFGDVLQIQFTGQESDIFQIDIKRDGSISIPDIGKIFISGLSLEEASKLIKDEINKSFIGVNTFVTLISVRDIQIIIAGNVFSPGPYTLNGNSNVFHALSVSGGPSAKGSYRKIDLIRDEETIETIDLYDTLIFGRPTFKTRLRSGDLLFVNPVGNLVSISGGVNRPFTYELNEDETLFDAISFSNGISADADLNDIKIFRLNDGDIEDIDVNGVQNLRKFKSKDRDKIVISKYNFRTVTINGAVKNPGTYFITDESGILDAIEQAGGYTQSAYPFGGMLENQAVLQTNLNSINTLYRQFIRELLVNQNSLDVESIGLLMQELRDSPASGRVIAEFNLEKLRSNPELDIILKNQDTLTIPERTDQVFIFGEVLEQGTTRFSNSKDIQDYINSKGGYGEFADKRSVYILQANGEIIKNKRNIFESDDNITISPGAVIYVPRKVNGGFFTTQAAQAYTQILSNLGVSLASLAAITD